MPSKTSVERGLIERATGTDVKREHAPWNRENSSPAQSC
jgi:hypothetical protein